MNVNVAALQPVSAAFDHQATDGFITAGADYHVKTAPAFDVGGGVPLGERRGVGIGPSHSSQEQSAMTSEAGTTGTTPFALSARSNPLGRSETAAHLSDFNVEKCSDALSRLSASVIVGLILFASSPTSDAISAPLPDAYMISDLGTLGGSRSFAVAVNGAGHTVGSSKVEGDMAEHAFLFIDGAMTDLGTLGGTNSAALGINDLDDVVGAALPAGDAANHAVLFRAGAAIDLGTLGGTTSVAYGINARGDIVGLAFTSEGRAHSFLRPDGGTMIDIDYPGALAGNAFGVNDSMHVVGFSTFAGLDDHAFLYTEGGLADLGTLRGPGSSVAFAVNIHDQIVGFSTLGPDEGFHAFLYHEGKMSDIGTLSGRRDSVALAINSGGQVVGRAQGVGMTTHAFLYTDGIMTDLNDLLPSNSEFDYLESAYGINDAGQIVGDGLVHGERHAFLLTPVIAY